MTSFQFNFYALAPLISGLIISTFGIFIYLKSNRTKTHLSWLLVCASLFIWTAAESLLISTRDIYLALFLTKIIYIGVTGIPFSVLYFTLNITKTKYAKTSFLFFLSIYLAIVIFSFKSNFLISGVNNYFWGFYPRASKYHTIYLLFWVILYIWSLRILHKKLHSRTTKDTEKDKILFCYWAFFLAGIIGPLDFLPKYGIEFYPIGYFCIPFFIVPIGLAIYKHNLMDIKIAIRKGLVYSLLIAILTSLYLLLILLMEWLFRGIIGYKSIALSLTSAFLMALLFNPLRNKIQDLIDNFFLGNSAQKIASENFLLKQELKRTERLKLASTLALGLAHEIRNPLTTIQTFAEYLPKKLKDEDFIRKFSSIIPSEVQRINAIIKQLLDFSKPNPPDFRNVNIYQIIQEILLFLNSEFLRHQIKLNESFHDTSLMIYADPDQIKQALLNVIFNSFDAMSKGGTIKIEVASNSKDSLNIKITDEGCGIAKEDLKQIFDPFFSKKDGGTGLGLAITYQIIKNHNGTIKVESELDKGTTFTIILPLT